MPADEGLKDKDYCGIESANLPGVNDYEKHTDTRRLLIKVEREEEREGERNGGQKEGKKEGKGGREEGKGRENIQAAEL